MLMLVKSCAQLCAGPILTATRSIALLLDVDISI
jgi:hypothetical protein